MITSSLLRFPCGAIYRDISDSLSPIEIKVPDASRPQIVTKGKL